MFPKRIVISLTFSLLLLTRLTQAQSWTQQSPTGSAPTPRYGNTAIYDTTNNLMTIFAGSSGITTWNDVWALSNANGLDSTTSAWIELLPTGTPPTTRFRPTAVYDTTHNLMTIFAGSGSNGVELNDTWVLSNANGLDSTTSSWSQISIFTGILPTARRGHTAIYDNDHNLMTVFGGANFTLGTTFNDVWVLSYANGQGGTCTWTHLTTSDNSPIPRRFHSAVYDAANNLMIIFGGYNGNILMNDTWVLSNANGLDSTTPTWTQLFPTGSLPTTRAYHTAVYNNAKNRMMIFGGSYDTTTAETLNDIWVLSNANGLDSTTPAWSQITVTGSTPTTRSDHTAVYDTNNNQMTIFGGSPNGGILYLNDVWVLNNADFVPVEDWMLYATESENPYPARNK